MKPFRQDNDMRVRKIEGLTVDINGSIEPASYEYFTCHLSQAALLRNREAQECRVEKRASSVMYTD